MRVIMKYRCVALNPFVSTMAICCYIVSGSIIISLVLSLPRWSPAVEGACRTGHVSRRHIVLLLGVMTIGTFISDLLLMWVDPRIRLERR